MIISFAIAGRRFRADLRAGKRLSITLNFAGEQPNHFDAPPASAAPLTLGDFIGNTRLGGSCNVSELTLVPHCNGTHTESAGHLSDDPVFIDAVLDEVFWPGTLLSVAPVPAGESEEGYPFPLGDDEAVITAAALQQAWERAGQSGFHQALIIRTRPNTPDKKSRHYATQAPPFFTSDAMQWISALDTTHLLVDIPSLDRMQDGGLLSNHRLFWGFPPESRRIAEARHPRRTVTEMIFAEDAIGDGPWLVNIQIPPFRSDAAPSRVMLFPLREENA